MGIWGWWWWWFAPRFGGIVWPGFFLRPDFFQAPVERPAAHAQPLRRLSHVATGFLERPRDEAVLGILHVEAPAFLKGWELQPAVHRGLSRRPVAHGRGQIAQG